MIQFFIWCVEMTISSCAHTTMSSTPRLCSASSIVSCANHPPKEDPVGLYTHSVSEGQLLRQRLLGRVITVKKDERYCAP